MKQIDFTLDAFGPDGLLKEGYEIRHKTLSTKAKFAGIINDMLILVYADGGVVIVDKENGEYNLSMVQLYRRTRTAEEVAREIYEETSGNEWNKASITYQEILTRYVQSGMDEITNP